MDGIMTVIVAFCITSVLIFWGGYELVDYYIFDHSIKVYEPIMPTIELIINDNKVDTLYVYRKP